MLRSLLAPTFYAFRHRFRRHGRSGFAVYALLLLGILVAVGLYYISCRVVGYFHGQNELGIILSLKIFEMAWVIMFAMLLFSAMVSGVSGLFLARDNEMLCSAPIGTDDLFDLRYTTITVTTSWMMVAFSLPIFSAFGSIFHTGATYWPLLLLAVGSTAATASALGMAVILVLVNLFPARRTRDIILYLSLLFGILLYLLIRLLRPEELADPERFPDFLEYLSNLQSPMAPLLPGTWPADLLSRYLQLQEVDWLLVALLLVTPMACHICTQWLMRRLFFSGFSKAQESFGGHHRFRAPGYSPSPLLWLWRKELRLFLRDSAEWSQLFLVAALIVVYLYNFKALPLERSPMPAEFLGNLIAYANIGLTGFLVASLCARFVYPSIGAEGEAFRMLATSPIPLPTYVAAKYLFYAVPFTLLTLTLLITSNHLLQVAGPMLWISVCTGCIITWSVVALALGFGCVFADFRIASRAATQGSFGVVAFLFCAVLYEIVLIVLGAGPAYRAARGWLRQGVLSGEHAWSAALTLALTALLALLVSLWTLRKGMDRLRRHV